MTLTSKVLLLTIFVFLIRNSPALAQWVQTNGVGGANINALVATGPYVFAAGTTVYRSSDNGITWIASGSGIPSGTSIRSLAVYGPNLYAGGDSGLFLSTNGGSTWTTLLSSAKIPGIMGILSVVADQGNLFAGTADSGVFRSTDNGANWTAVNNGATYFPWCLAIDSIGNLFAGDFSGGVYRSTNEGAAWTKVSDDSASSIVVSGNGHVFVGGGGGVYRSTDDGITWTVTGPGLLNVYALAVNSYGNVFSGEFTLGPSGGGIYSSTNDGDTWTQIGLTGLNFHSLAPTPTGYLFAGNDNGTIYRSAATTTPPLPPTPSLIAPTNRAVSVSLAATLSWDSSTGADLYEIQVASDSLFSKVMADDSTDTSTSELLNLQSAARYYWHVRAINVAGKSAFTPTWTFVTVVTPPTNLASASGNERITLSWTASTAALVVKYRIYRGTSQAATPLYDSCAATSFVDSGLANGTNYYYKVTAVDSLYGESGFSNEVSSSPFNKPPVAASLNNVSLLNTGRVLTNPETFSSSGSTDPDGTVDSTLWFVNYQRAATQPTLTYNFGPGTSRVTLVIVDNQGARDSSVAFVNRAAFVKTLGGTVTSGLSMVGGNVLYAIASGDAVYRLDSNETTVYKLQVSGSSGSSCSIAYDSTVYISSSDNNLYAFSKNATSVWPALPLGGNTSATPTVDSTLQRVYIGVSNNNFLGINRLTGTVVWNFFTSSPTSNSAVISSDRRLVFPTNDGSVYGVDLEASGDPTAPTWTLSLPDASPTSPAIDQYGYFYFGTAAGNLYAVSMKRSEQASQLWNLHLGGQLLAAPVIDANGILYIGSTDSTMYAVNLSSKSIAWKFKTNGSIRYSAAISPAGDIYFDNDAGELYCFDNAGNVKWSFIDPGDGLQVIGPILYNNGMVYAGAGTKSVIALYDGNGSQSSASRVSSVSTPIWGTFQGNNQRTGIQSIQIISSVSNDNAKLPTSYVLYANYPNPFNPSTTISYDIPKHTRVTLIIYDVLGRQVRELVNVEKSPGRYQATFNASDLPSGVYFYRLDAGTYSKTKKLVLLK